jgi:hypothetical protein
VFNKNKTNKIIFKAQREHSQFLSPIPKPASNIIPDWYKKEKNYSNGYNSLSNSIKFPSVGTFKLCTPLVDTLTSGYLITLPASIYVTNVSKDDKYLPYVNWNVEWPLLDSIEQETHTNYPVPVGFSDSMFRWCFDFKIETPSGYSCWITHPSHRWDLPFLTINGFVDTDKHPNRLLLPFFIREGFEGLIKEGTPIAQIIPIKRENWKSEKKDLTADDSFMIQNATKINFVRTYKDKYWSRKKYE